MIGESLALVAAFSFGCANVMVKKGISPKSKNNGAFLSVLITFGLAGIITLAKGLFQDWPPYTAKGIGWFVLAGFLTAYIGRSLLFTSIQHLGSVRASTLKRLNSLFTVLIGVLFLHESMNLMVFIGMIMIFASSSFLMYETIISNRRLQKHETAVANETTVIKSEKEKVSKRNSWIKRFKFITSLGYMYGVGSALAYSIGYVVRKEGLSEIPDPFFWYDDWGTCRDPDIPHYLFAKKVIPTIDRFDLYSFSTMVICRWNSHFIRTNFIFFSINVQ